MGARMGVRRLRPQTRGRTQAVKGSVAVVTSKPSGPIIRDDLEQNTPPWLSWRDDHICGSDAPIIMLADGYADPYRLFLEKMGRAPRREFHNYYEGGELVEHPAIRGHRLEDVARDWYCRDRGLFTAPYCLEHHSIAYMACSLDGWPDHSAIMEIKCPSNIRLHL